MVHPDILDPTRILDNMEVRYSLFVQIWYNQYEDGKICSNHDQVSSGEFERHTKTSWVLTPRKFLGISVLQTQFNSMV